MSDTYNPADHTVDEVNQYLTDHPDETAAVLAAEEQGEARKGILSGPHATPADEPSYDDAVERGDVGTTDAFIIPNHNTIPQAGQVEDADRRNTELEEAGVNHAQGFIGSDGSANLLG